MPNVTIDALLEQVRANLAEKLTQRNTHNDAIRGAQEACMADKRDPSDTEAQTVRSATEARAGIDAEIDQLNARKAELESEKQRDETLSKLHAEVQPTRAAPKYDEVIHRGDVKEPRTYTPETSARGVSFFSDAWHYDRRSGGSDTTARVQRHASEVSVHNEMPQRAMSTGSFGGLVVPQYLVDLAAPVLRAGRPFANSIGPSLPLPETGMKFDIPRGTTGSEVDVQVAENTSITSVDQVWGDLTLNVSTIAGQADVSRQTLERGSAGADSLIYLDLAGSYGVKVDRQCLSGSGASGQVLGALNTAGVYQATPYTAAVTAQTFYSKTAGAVNGVMTARYLPPNAIVMHPRRWNWLLTQVDNNGRPLVVPSAQGPWNAMATTDGPVNILDDAPAGWFQGLAVYIDASIPIAVGTAAEDVEMVYRKEDLLLWEDGDGAPRELRFDQTLANQLTVKLVSYGYIAFTAGRYPQAIGVVGGNSTAGNGQVAPTF